MNNVSKLEMDETVKKMGDLLQYILKAKLNGEDIGKIKRLLPILIELIEVRELY